MSQSARAVAPSAGGKAKTKNAWPRVGDNQWLVRPKSDRDTNEIKLDPLSLLRAAHFREALADAGGKVRESSAAFALSVMLLRARRSASGRLESICRRLAELFHRGGLLQPTPVSRRFGPSHAGSTGGAPPHPIKSRVIFLAAALPWFV